MPDWEIGPGAAVSDWGIMTSQWFRDDEPVVFRVGRDDEMKHFPTYHPGPLAMSHGLREHTFIIEFFCDASDIQNSRVELDVYCARGPVPVLEVAVNDHVGWIYLDDPKRSDRRAIISGPIAGWASRAIPVSKERLVAGLNRLRITTKSDAPPDSSPGGSHLPYRDVFGSGIRYGRIAFKGGPGSASGTAAVGVKATPLYRSTSGGLVELIEVTATADKWNDPATIELRIGDVTTNIDLDLAGRCFGDARRFVEVPETEAEEIDVAWQLRSGDIEARGGATLRPRRKWELLLIPHAHLDVGYTDYQGKVLELHARNIDRVLDDLDADGRARYSVDGNVVIKEYLETRPDPSRLRRALEEGSLSVNAFPFSFLTGMVSTEEMLRAGEPAPAGWDVATVRYANLTDVPSYSWALPTILKSLGIEYFLGIANHTRAANRDSDELHLRSPLRWEGPDGSQVLCFFADHYVQLRRLATDHPTIPAAAEGFRRFIEMYDRDDYLPSVLPIIGSTSDNEDLEAGLAAFTAAWNSAYAYPRLRLGTVADYFDAVKDLTESLPMIQGDGGSYWEDGAGTAAALVARYREGQTTLLGADAASALVSFVVRGTSSPAPAISEAWQELLFGAEHTWTYAHATDFPDSRQIDEQLAWKALEVDSALRFGREETRRALSRLHEGMQAKGPAVLVANPSSWPRGGVIEAELMPGMTIDASNPSVLGVEGAITDTGLRRLRMQVAPLPGFGYVRLPIVPDDEAAEASAGREILGAFNRWRSVAPSAPGRTEIVSGPDGSLATDGPYSLTFDGANVAQIHDQRLGVDLLDPGASWSFGAVLHVQHGTAAGRGRGTERTRLSDTYQIFDAPDLEVEVANAELTSIEQSPLGTYVSWRGSARTMPEIAWELFLPTDGAPVRLEIELTKEPELAKESVYVAFPFAGDRPRVVVDRQVGWVDPATDHLPGACNDWLTVINTVGLVNARSAMMWSALDAPLFAVGDLVRGRWAAEWAAENGHLYSWIMNNYWYTNTPARQSGRMRFRYAMSGAERWDPAVAARFGREVRSPLLAEAVSWLDKRRDTGEFPDAGSLLDLDTTGNVVVTAHASGNGSLVLRFVETAGTVGSATVTHPRGARGSAHFAAPFGADRAAIEIDASGRFAVEVGPYSISTVRLG